MRRALPLILLFACQEYNISSGNKDEVSDPAETDVSYGICGFQYDERLVDPFETCGPYAARGFTPWVEFTFGRNKSSRSTPIVADIDGDGLPEILANITGFLPGDKGELWVMKGDGSGALWKKKNANLGYGSSVAVADLDADGDAEIVGVRALNSQSPIGNGSDYKLVAWDHEGNELWTSESVKKNNFDYASAPLISDMDHDGSPEIVVGRVIFNADGTERGRGVNGRGSFGLMPGNASEASVPTIADIDLDGVEEVIVGNAMYTPDGDLKWDGSRFNDGFAAVANLDDDPEGEFVVSSFGTIRAHDTDGKKMWGPITLLCVSPACDDTDSSGDDSANILSVPAIADIDNDGRPEIVVAGGSQIVAFNHDGTQLWQREVQDLSGASGASIFDFEGDGIQDVVYLDEVAVYAFDGDDGDVKFFTNEHASDTMMDYPVIADVDGDGEAEIVAAHANFGVAVTVYGQGDGSWAPARPLWNQHAYARNHINDDLTVPRNAVPHFTDHNTYHAASDPDLLETTERVDLKAAIREVCELQCDLGVAFVAVQPINHSADNEVPAGVPVTLYAVRGNRLQKIQTLETTQPIAKRTSGEQMVFEVPADLASSSDGFRVYVDDDGNGGQRVPECVEDDNTFDIIGPFCR